MSSKRDQEKLSMLVAKTAMAVRANVDGVISTQIKGNTIRLTMASDKDTDDPEYYRITVSRPSRRKRANSRTIV